jgi:methylase of polypeptide subunit release factors
VAASADIAGLADDAEQIAAQVARPLDQLAELLSVFDLGSGASELGRSLQGATKRQAGSFRTFQYNTQAAAVAYENAEDANLLSRGPKPEQMRAGSR